MIPTFPIFLTAKNVSLTSVSNDNALLVSCMGPWKVAASIATSNPLGDELSDPLCRVCVDRKVNGVHAHLSRLDKAVGDSVDPDNLL